MVDVSKCDRCGDSYVPYGSQTNPEANTVELTFLFPNGAGLQKMARYKVCPYCMGEIKDWLEGCSIM